MPFLPRTTRTSIRRPAWLPMLLGLWLACVSVGAAAAQDEAAGPSPGAVLVVRIEGPIGPATAAQVQAALQRAASEAATLVVLEMDTPGGLDDAMRDIVKGVLASTVPVAGYVAPRGARAASAGTYILYATHVAVMAPATNLGAATPVAVGMPGAPERPPAGASEPGGSAAPDAMTAKRVNDAAAYLRGLAQLRGRNAEWAEQAVRESVSLSATDALDRRVIDLIAADRTELLARLHGREVALGPDGSRTVTLVTAGAPIVVLEPDWRGRLLAIVSNPSLALVLLMVGVYGLLFEFISPGSLVPGVIGGVCLLLAMWGLQMLPLNYAGLALLLLGIALLVAEAFVPSFGVLGLGGVVAFAFGAVMLIDADVPGYAIPAWLIAGMTALTALAVLGVAGMAARARRRPVARGLGGMIGARGAVLEFGGDEGWVQVRGERWRAHSTGPLTAGEAIHVTGASGLVLEVRPAAATPASR